MHQRKEHLKPIKTQCPVCEKKFDVMGQLKEHMVSAYLTAAAAEDGGGSGELACKLEACGQAYSRHQPRLKLLFYHHVLYHHFGERYKFRCDNCDYQAVTASKLRQHLLSHENERPFACPSCPQTFRTRPKLSDHVRIVHDRAKPLVCAACQATFARGRDLRKHHESRHANVVHPCDSCTKTFRCAQSLRVHTRNVHAEQRRLICDRCALDTGTCSCAASAPVAGRKRGAVTERDTVVCPLCSKAVAARRMAGHLHYHRQSSLRPYICQQCSKVRYVYKDFFLFIVSV
jgi:KRAB domain-containing zinc finger protein